MKIAVSYDNGNVFGHFGKTENFKVYEIENGEIVKSEVVNTNGTGHEALASFLAQISVEAVICGGIGDGATAALNEENIEIISGIDGSADEAALLYAKGELVSKGGHCDHHEEESEEGCDGCGGDCSGGCGGCGGGCRPQMLEGKNSGKIVKVHYRGTFDNGEQFDSSYDRNEPLEFICGTGMMIKGFDMAVVNMEVGESVDVHLMPSEAYGEYNENAVFTVNIAELPGSETLEAGRKIVLSNAYGQNFPALVKEKTEDTITFDTNHEMAGKELNFHIELVEVK